MVRNGILNELTTFSSEYSFLMLNCQLEKTPKVQFSKEVYEYSFLK